MNVNPGIFKTYDIRGIWGTDLSSELAAAIGQAFATFLKPKKVVVGRDVRLSGPAMQRAFVEGVRRMGVDVTDIGVVTSDALYFAVGKYGFDAGVIVTASHNPPQWNGFKFVGKSVAPIYGDKGIKQIGQIVQDDAFDPPVASEGTYEEFEITADYLSQVLSFAGSSGGKKLKVIVDPGNGTAARFVPAIMEKLPYAWEGMNMALDGRFPGRDPNPLKQGALDGLQERVLAAKADVGVAFDADADRAFFMDEKGNRVFGDVLLALLAKHFLQWNPGAAVVYNLICSHIVPEEVRKSGGKPIRSPVGHAFIKAGMREHDAIFGGEISGHFYFRDHYYADSGLIAMVVALEYLRRQQKPLSELVRDIDIYAHTAEVNVEVDDIPAAIARVKQAFNDGTVDELDGVTVEYPEWWLNVRPSNTEPLLRISVEAKTKAEMERRRDEIIRLIRDEG